MNEEKTENYPIVFMVIKFCHLNWVIHHDFADTITLHFYVELRQKTWIGAK